MYLSSFGFIYTNLPVSQHLWL